MLRRDRDFVWVICILVLKIVNVVREHSGVLMEIEIEQRAQEECFNSISRRIFRVYDDSCEDFLVVFCCEWT